jgi:hypothetical protein
MFRVHFRQLEESACVGLHRAVYVRSAMPMSRIICPNGRLLRLRGAHDSVFLPCLSGNADAAFMEKTENKMTSENASRPSFLGLFRNQESVVALKRGDILFRKGDPARHMYVVLSGEVSVGDGDKVFEHVSAGGMLGEMALIDHAPRAATVTAETDTTLAEVDEKRFLFLIQQAPSFALNVMRLLSLRLRSMGANTGS